MARKQAKREKTWISFEKTVPPIPARAGRVRGVQREGATYEEDLVDRAVRREVRVEPMRDGRVKVRAEVAEVGAGVEGRAGLGDARARRERDEGEEGDELAEHGGCTGGARGPRTTAPTRAWGWLYMRGETSHMRRKRQRRLSSGC